MATPTRTRLRDSEAPEASETVERTTKGKSFLDVAFEINHSWEEVDSYPLTEEELEAIKEIRVAQGTYNKRFDFKMKDGSVRGLSMSSTCEDYPVGTRIRPSSVRIYEVYDEMDEKTIFRVSGRRL